MVMHEKALGHVSLHDHGLMGSHVRFHRLAHGVHEVLDLASLCSYGVQGTRVAAIDLWASKGSLVTQLIASRTSNLCHIDRLYR
jgi:hypothetical protein